jgi:hypothetical protein
MQTSLFPFEPRQARAVSLNAGWGLVVSAATCWPCPTRRGGGRSACCDYYMRENFRLFFTILSYLLQFSAVFLFLPALPLQMLHFACGVAEIILEMEGPLFQGVSVCS